VDILVKDSSKYGINATDFDPILMQYAQQIKDFGLVTLQTNRSCEMTSSTN
jgi:hypothetical protein